MATAVRKITLVALARHPLPQAPALSQANVRRVKAGVSIEELAEDIARRGLLHGLSASAPSPTRPATRPACSRSRPAVAATARSNCS
jgi:hypothetical protein